jgi:CheY-like chemotaxis protein/anti-sigma regulatory factor (Ser/Thr protein kinase)
VPQLVRADGGRLRQIVANLVGNAVKFTERGAVTIAIRLEAEAGSRVRVRFEVIDTGIGVDPAMQARIFEPFIQADATATRKYGGSGLGLAICRELVALMEGHFGVTSEPGRGSVFWFVVPLIRIAPAAETAAETPVDGPAPRPADAEARPSARQILLVEDNLVNQEVARGFLEVLGHRCDVVPGGNEALVAVRARRYDVVLMDSQMPGMDGLSATRAIRELEERGVLAPPRLSILAVTAHALAGDRDRCLDAGMDGYLSKPFTLESLEAALEEVLALAHRRESALASPGER